MGRIPSAFDCVLLILLKNQSAEAGILHNKAISVNVGRSGDILDKTVFSVLKSIFLFFTIDLGH